MPCRVTLNLPDEEFLDEADVVDVTALQLQTQQLHYQQRWHLIALSLSCLVLLLAALLEILPQGRVAFRFWPEVPMPETCMTKIATGFPCPGCGLTRSFVYLTHGDVAASLQINRAGIVLYGLLMIQFPYRFWLLHELRQGQPNRRRWPGILAAIAACSVMANWILIQAGW